MAAQPFRWMDAYGGAEGSVVRAESLRDHAGNTILSVGYHSADITIKNTAVGELLAMAPVLLDALRGLLEYHRRDDYVGLAKGYQDAADAAIEKATGKRP